METKSKSILIVEDDQELASLIKVRLESVGYGVMWSARGAEALEVIRQKFPDLVVLDVFLPDMDGLTILKQIKFPIDINTGQPSTQSRTPVVVITGGAFTVEHMSRAEGAADFFVKPVDVNKLANRISELLGVGTETGTTRKKILVVDDDKDYSDLMRMRLERAGYEVLTAANGKEAIELLGKNYVPDLIILDLEMPDKNGLTTLVNFKLQGEKKTNGAKRPRIPVLVATGLKSERIQKIVEGYQIDGYLNKPFNAEDLLEKVGSILSKVKVSDGN